LDCRKTAEHVTAPFINGQNLHEIETLAAAAESVGLNGGELDEVLRSKTSKTAVDQDWLRSHHLSITAVPTFHLNGENLVGAQPYEQLAAFLTTQRMPPRSSSKTPQGKYLDRC